MYDYGVLHDDHYVLASRVFLPSKTLYFFLFLRRHGLWVGSVGERAEDTHSMVSGHHHSYTIYY